MDSLGEPVEEGSAGNLVNCDIAGVLLKRDVGLSRKCCYPIHFFLLSYAHSIHPMTPCLELCNKQEKKQKNVAGDLSHGHAHGRGDQRKKRKRSREGECFPRLWSRECNSEWGINRRERGRGRKNGDCLLK